MKVPTLTASHTTMVDRFQPREGAPVLRWRSITCDTLIGYIVSLELVSVCINAELEECGSGGAAFRAHANATIAL